MHISVLQKEVVHCLSPKPNENFIDCTIGRGGHALAIIEQILPKGKVLGIDWSPELIRGLKVKSNLILVCDNFGNLKEIVEKKKFRPVSGILFDLGMSSWHLEESKKGFSFLRNEPLDMRYRVKEIRNNLTAEEIVNTWPEKEIERILRLYGEERFSKRIARKIIENKKIKPIKTTFQIAEIIKKATPVWYHRKKIHPATRTFQALRIAVNDELNNLKKALPQAIEILRFGGRLVVISFHSLEDRIVKNFLKEKNKENLIEILTKKPIRPSAKEIKTNPRSRSAKLRAIVKL